MSKSEGAYAGEEEKEWVMDFFFYAGQAAFAVALGCYFSAQRLGSHHTGSCCLSSEGVVLDRHTSRRATSGPRCARGRRGCWAYLVVEAVEDFTVVSTRRWKGDVPFNLGG